MAFVHIGSNPSISVANLDTRQRVEPSSSKERLAGTVCNITGTISGPFSRLNNSKSIQHKQMKFGVFIKTPEINQNPKFHKYSNSFYWDINVKKSAFLSLTDWHIVEKPNPLPADIESWNLASNCVIVCIQRKKSENTEFVLFVNNTWPRRNVRSDSYFDYFKN